MELMKIEDLSDDYLKCRALRHAWDEHPNPEYSPDLFRAALFALAVRCTRCHSERYYYFDKSFDIFSKRYIYPPGYKTIPGSTQGHMVMTEMSHRSLLVESYKRRNGRR
jgi:hypothetical protein